MIPHEPGPVPAFDTLVRLVFGGLAIASIVVLGVAWSLDGSREVDLEGDQVDRPSGPLLGADRTVEPPPGEGHLFGDIAGVRAAGFSGGNWYLLDQRNWTVHVVDTLGEYVRGVGRQGQGPGEFMRPVAMAVGDSDLWVSAMGSPVLQRFAVSGEFITTHTLDNSSCAPGTIASMATVSDGLLVLRRCVLGGLRIRLSFVGIDGRHLELDPPIELSGDALGIPVLASDHRGRVMLGDGSTGCLIDLRWEEGRLLPLGPPTCPDHVERAPVPDDVREALEDAAARARGITELALPDSAPLFDGLSIDPMPMMRTIVSDDRMVWRTIAPGELHRIDPGPGVTTILDQGRILMIVEELEGTRLYFPAPLPPAEEG